MHINLPMGLFGSSFNPPHTAHFALVRAAAQQLDLASVQLIPAGQPWQKPHVLAAEHRLAMLEHALHDEQLSYCKVADDRICSISINAYEIHQNQPSYTIDTLTYLRAQYPSTPLIWITGSDQIKNLSTWHRWNELLDYCHIAVAQRAGHEINVQDLSASLRDLYNAQRVDAHQSIWRTALYGHFISFIFPPQQVSSSTIRAALAQGQRPETLHPSVAHYIYTQHLYKDSQ